MQTREPAIIVEDIKTRFGSKVVHNGVSCSIPKGAITAIIGGSGSGKSVLFREVVGLLRPGSGRIKVLGEEIWKLSEDDLGSLRQRLGILFQNGALFSGLTVADNVATSLREWTKLPESTISVLVYGKLRLSGLEAEAGRKMPSDLSGGMVKRAALARALALEPEVLFLDEPTSGLDPVMARAFDELVRTLCDGLGITVCMITHDLTSIRSISDHVVVLGDGRLLTEGPFEKVREFDHPWIESYFRGDRVE